MYAGVAIGTAIGEKLFLAGGNNASVARVVALDAEKRHGGREQAPADGTVRDMTVNAVFSHIAMLIDERTAFFGMAAAAKFLDRTRFQQLGAR